MNLSVVIIAKNAENDIADALSSVKFCNEIIVIDSGSTDKTVDIAKKMGAKVFAAKVKDYASARNFGLQKAKGNWIFYTDTDERVTEELKKEIESEIGNRESGIVAYKVKRKNFYYGNHEWPYIEKLERLFRKKNLKEWYGELHESPKIDGTIGELDGFLFHYSHKDLSSMVNKTILWSVVEAKLRYDANHPKMTWWRFPRVMITVFFNSYIKQRGWKAGIVGLIEGFYQAFSIFITYSKLWELQESQKK